MENFARWEEYAPHAYEVIRDADDVADIARNSAWPAARIHRIKAHLFYGEHRLADGVRRFAPDPDIADAWARLTRGEHCQEDMDLLAHE